MDNQTSITQQEDARAKLRESFLMAINELCGQPCSILTYEKNILPAIFTGWQIDGFEVLVRDLKTPAHMFIESARIRTSDILSLKFDNPVPLP